MTTTTEGPRGASSPASALLTASARTTPARVPSRAPASRTAHLLHRRNGEEAGGPSAATPSFGRLEPGDSVGQPVVEGGRRGSKPSRARAPEMSALLRRTSPARSGRCSISTTPPNLSMTVLATSITDVSTPDPRCDDDPAFATGQRGGDALAQVPDIDEVTRLAAVAIHHERLPGAGLLAERGDDRPLVVAVGPVDVGETQCHRRQTVAAGEGGAVPLTRELRGAVRRLGPAGMPSCAGGIDVAEGRARRGETKPSTCASRAASNACRVPRTLISLSRSGSATDAGRPPGRPGARRSGSRGLRRCKASRSRMSPSTISSYPARLRVVCDARCSCCRSTGSRSLERRGPEPG